MNGGRLFAAGDRHAQHESENPPTLTNPAYAGCRHDRRPVPGRAVRQQPGAPAKAPSPGGGRLRAAGDRGTHREGWRLTDTAAAQFVPLFRSIRPATPVELTDKELADALTPFSPGPQKRTAVAA